MWNQADLEREVEAARETAKHARRMALELRANRDVDRARLRLFADALDGKAAELKAQAQALRVADRGIARTAQGQYRFRRPRH
jgi:hypothetical protein